MNRPLPGLALALLLLATACSGPPKGKELPDGGSADGGGRKPLPPGCALPETLAFGQVLVGRPTIRPLTVQAPADRERVFTVLAPPPFSVLGPDSDAGDFFVAAGESRDLLVHLQADSAADHATELFVERAGCDRGRIQTTASVLDVGHSASLDFGAVSPGRSRRLTIDLSNPLLGERLRLQPQTIGLPGVTLAAGEVDLCKGCSTELFVFYEPDGGVLDGGIVLRDPQGTGTWTVPVRGRMGGPELTPDGQIEFGRVAYFQNPLTYRRSVPLRNDGDAPAKLGNADGGPTFEVRIFEGAPSTADVSLRGTGGIGPGSAVRLEVALTPRATGVIAGLAIVHLRDDPDQPRLEVPFSAQGVLLLPCELSVSASALDFGSVAERATQTLRVENLRAPGTAGGDCQLHELRLGTHPIFASDLDELWLAPGESAVIPVSAAAPPSAGESTFAWSFGVSRPVQPRQPVSLHARRSLTCLSTSPDRIDFGANALACGPANRGLTVHNVCAQQIELRKFGLDRGDAGFAAETVPPFVPPLGFVRIPVTFEPPGEGPFRDVLELHEIQPDAGRALAFFRTELTGQGAEDGGNHVRHEVPARPRVDVLLVAGSSSDDLARHVHDLLTGARENDVDLHIAGANSSTPELGPLLPFATGDDPDVEARIATWFRIPNGGYSTAVFDRVLATVESAAGAGSAGGFRRQGAHLAILIATDRKDSSKVSVDAFLARLRRATGDDPRRLSISAFAPFAKRCSDVVEYGQIRSVVIATGGYAGERCGTTLDAVSASRAMFRIGRDVQLTAEPADGGVLSFHFDELAVSPNATWDPERNTLRLPLLEEPSPGTTLTVDYEAACK